MGSEYSQHLGSDKCVYTFIQLIADLYLCIESCKSVFLRTKMTMIRCVLFFVIFCGYCVRNESKHALRNEAGEVQCDCGPRSLAWERICRAGNEYFCFSNISFDDGMNMTPLGPAKLLIIKITKIINFQDLRY